MTKPPEANITAHHTVLISQDSNLIGKITFGPGCIVHPKASIQALTNGGEVILGKDCVVEEMALIVHRGDGAMRIGQGNTFQVGSHVEAQSIGDFNTFQPKSKVPSGLMITDHCTISAGTTLFPHDPNSSTPEILPPFSVVYGKNSDRRIWDQSTLLTDENLRIKQVEYLREVIPKYNRMRVL